MKKRVLRFESLEDRRLLAVAAGLETPFPEPTAAVPAGAAVGDVYIASTLDADGDGFIGPAELSYMSHAWFASDGGDRWNPASDLDGDGFVGPGDYALLSSNWFKTNDGLPESTRSYQIYPSDIGNWILFGDQVSKISARGGTLTLDAGGGGLEAVCDYDAFPENLRVTADFKTAGVSAAFQAGIELAVQESGARYCAEIQPDRACLYYVDGSGRMSLLDGAFYTFSPNETYTVWVQKSDSFLSFGVGSGTLISVSDARLSGGQVGFYASEGIGAFSHISVENNPAFVPAPETRVGDVIVRTKFAENGVPLPEPVSAYEIYPSDPGNWFLFGDQVSKVTAKNGVLTIDAQNGALEALCDYGAFEENIRVAAGFKGTGAFRAGIELAVQDSGARYYAEFRNDGVSLYYVDEGESFIPLHSVGYTFAAGRTYTVWMQLAGGQLACGVRSETLIALDETRLSGGGVGFYASGGIGAFSDIRAESEPVRVENTVDLPEAGKQILITDSATGLSYWLFVPTDTSAGTKDGFPLMLFLHGAGERGNPANVKVHGPPMLLENGWAGTWPFITVSPSCPSGATWSASQLLRLLDEVVERLPVDESRVYVTGVSMGGHGTWDMLLADPDRFAAAAPICGWSDPSRAPLLVDVPIWVFHGDADTQVSWKNSSNMVDAIRAAGGTKVEFTLYPGVGHNSWTVTYNNRDLYTWFLRQSR